MKKSGRKTIICSRCSKKKLSFGLGMCSSCLRRTKRETRPSFYLGTCYSEMCRRVNHFDLLRPKYFGKKICTKEQFFNRFLNDRVFLDLFKNWQENNFVRRESPSIDRIDNDGDYCIDNLQFLKHTENTGKDNKNRMSINRKKVLDSDGKIYKNVASCAIINKVSRSNLRKYIELNRELNGKSYKFI